MYHPLKETIAQLDISSITNDRKAVLKELIDYINNKLAKKEAVRLNFICTHNSRRSQLSQIWAKIAAAYYGISIATYSGGVEVTAFNERAVEALKKSGLKIEGEVADNPVYKVYYSDSEEPILAFSKVYDNPINPNSGFAAVMTCSHADENCPFIPGTEQRIPVRYDDPKEFDGTDQEAEKYLERSLQIANEMFYVFSKIREK
ncbi:arsenate reductase/protein-tyrosine-phosphatase family protein [Fulvivirga lutea]|uniref:Protein-tyrosine-phosphatase n=1 Tax=Fulvivirga lutea TaxID=2810512 RepID=A0A975A0M5_9BACT|nr:protein-tyrosine-phosphatase [Fulvivirga lutea]QSE96597.1 protein-tyrosine-phosphatase [Fulvivirga lutea]